MGRTGPFVPSVRHPLTRLRDPAFKCAGPRDGTLTRDSRLRVSKTKDKVYTRQETEPGDAHRGDRRMSTDSDTQGR